MFFVSIVRIAYECGDTDDAFNLRDMGLLPCIIHEHRRKHHGGITGDFLARQKCKADLI